MKAVMISIRPEWVAKILSGEKTVEVRKTAPKLETPFRCYTYETQGKTDTPWIDEEGHMIFRGRGQVVAEFVCDRIDEYTNYSLDEQKGHTERREKLLRSACMTLRDWRDYIGNYRSDFGYAWHIFKLKIYDKPKNLSEFQLTEETVKRIRNRIAHFEFGIDDEVARKLTRPPQSWCYVEELR